MAGEHSTSTERVPLFSSFDSQLTQSRTPHELMRSISPRSITAVPLGILSTRSASSLSSSITPPSFTKLMSPRCWIDDWNLLLIAPPARNGGSGYYTTTQSRRRELHCTICNLNGPACAGGFETHMHGAVSAAAAFVAQGAV